MNFNTELECQYPAVGSTDLWQLFKLKVSKSNLSTGLLEAVGKICIEGITLSKDIICFFPTFTLHDETHIVNVCNWMVHLLGEEQDKLSAHEAALLAMAACCHDIGMSVSARQENILTANPESLEWKKYFENHYSDDEEFSKTGIISKRMLRNYVRLNHHRLVREKLNEIEWPEILIKNSISCLTVSSLCQSHGQKLEELSCPKGMPYDLRLCAVLLRISDILDFDSSRAPISLFKQLGLDDPDDFETRISQMEWMKNRAGVFGSIKDGMIPFTASFTNLQLEYEVHSYLEWVHQELTCSSEYLAKYAGKWQDLKLPREISTDSIERKGYRFGRFCMTLDQDQVLSLFAGENLYGNPCVFVRELLQNSLDAVLLRSVLDKNFSKKDGRVTIYSWTDCEGKDWFRIEDNGVGMDENIITGFFLTVGRSYYTSEIFKAERRHYASGTDYLPISRFGIGVLSCFMGDSENTLLEVSTRRYAHDRMRPNPAIRMNVTGLHGYYYLVREDEQSDNDVLFQPMHHPKNLDLGYHIGVGTTICVQVDRNKMRIHQSFKEIVDNYVCFPEIRVEYFGPEGHFAYPTKQELMDSVHSLNDDIYRPVKEYRHSISEKQFAELKKALPNVIWEETPYIIMKYFPLDWFSSAEKMSGTAVYAYAEVSAEIAPLVCGSRKIPFLIIGSCENEVSSEEIKFEFSIICDLSVNKRERFKKYEKEIKKYEKKYSINISYPDLLLQMNEYETTVFQYMIKRQYHDPDVNRIAYKGITADASNPFCLGTCCWSSVFLLDGSYRPEVCLSRNSITRLPLEAACDLAILQKVMYYETGGDFHSTPEFLHTAMFPELTEQRMLPLLDKHPDWEKWLKYIGEDYCISACSDSFNGELHEVSISQSMIIFSKFSQMIESTIVGLGIFIIDFLYDWIWMTLVKRYTDFYEGAPDTSKFPVVLFCMPPIPDAPLGMIRSSRRLNYYNSCHHFSRWLIQYQDVLQTQTPTLYTRLINTMIWSESYLQVIKSINETLTSLRMIDGNPFGVTDTLFIKESDFVNEEHSV